MAGDDGTYYNNDSVQDSTNMKSDHFQSTGSDPGVEMI
jgi:BT1 family